MLEQIVMARHLLNEVALDLEQLLNEVALDLEQQGLWNLSKKTSSALDILMQLRDEHAKLKQLSDEYNAAQEESNVD